MVVDEDVAVALRERSHAQVAVFVAGCVERMAQMFIGLRGDAPGRDNDVDTVIRLLEELWNSEVPRKKFQSYVDCLSDFPELDDSFDEEIVDPGEIYSFYAVLALRYAALHRSRGEIEAALKCAHACLTAMGQLDQNIPVAMFFAQETECQQRVVSSCPPDGAADEVAQLRVADRVMGQERLAALQERLSY
ncbi:hypothetical protein [Streptomyces varsoviensis]|uniref:hypothetical protein n=1 Tax=Streptomyces varsoviensis TaxID=67373 RepID=UPI000AA0B778|nr:hypothetical protein [Streptomyces varsoviensis]